MEMKLCMDQLKSVMALNLDMQNAPLRLQCSKERVERRQNSNPYSSILPHTREEESKRQMVFGSQMLNKVKRKKKGKNKCFVLDLHTRAKICGFTHLY